MGPHILEMNERIAGDQRDDCNSREKDYDVRLQLPHHVPSFLFLGQLFLRWTCWISQEFECHNLPLVVLGTFALWFPGRALCWWICLVAPECKSIRLFVDGLVGPCWSWTIPSPLWIDFLHFWMLFFLNFGYVSFFFVLLEVRLVRLQPGLHVDHEVGQRRRLGGTSGHEHHAGGGHGRHHRVPVARLGCGETCWDKEIGKLGDPSDMIRNVGFTWFTMVYHPKLWFTRENWMWMCRNSD